MRINDLARWVTTVSTVPPQVQQASVRVVVDAVAAALAGHQLTGATAARAAAEATWGAGNSTIWFTSQRGSVTAAAFSNAMATSILDLDDGHRAACGHPGAAIVPAVLAAAEDLDITGERVLTAIAIGYEVGIRVIASLDVRAVDTLVTGRWCGQGVAAAIGWLKGDDADRIAEAIAIAGAVAPYMLVAEYTQVGNHTKEAIPFGTANGVLAGSLAENGFKGPRDILDHSNYNADVLAHGAGSSWYIETTYFKPYSCCRWIHAPIDGILSLAGEVDWTCVDELEVQTFGRTMSLNNQVDPSTVQAAQYSTPYCVAVAAIRGAASLQPMTEAILNDEAVRALSGKVRLTVDPQLDAMFPAAVPGRVRVTAGGQVFEREVLAPKGEATNPLTWDELTGKLLNIAKPRLDEDQTTSLLNALRTLRDDVDLRRLFDCLRR